MTILTDRHSFVLHTFANSIDLREKAREGMRRFVRKNTFAIKCLNMRKPQLSLPSSLLCVCI